MQTTTAPKTLELKGNLRENPLAELIREFTEARLSGSFRLAHEANKVIVYLNKGVVVFAVSNLRHHRLFEFLLQSEKITKERLREIPDFANDMALSEKLIADGTISKAEIDTIFSYQIKDILRTAMTWEGGEWIFSPLAKIKESIHFKVDWISLNIEYGRNMINSSIIKRFRSFEENFGVNTDISEPNMNLQPQEAFVLSRFEGSLMRVADVRNSGGLSDSETLKHLYVLWLGNSLSRRNWNSVLTPTKIRDILSARLSIVGAIPIIVKTEAEPVISATVTAATDTAAPETSAKPARTEKEIVESYLKRVEEAESYYDMLEIPIKSNVTQIKTAYFQLAKSFHPDKYHNEADSKLQQRIQHAFTEIARAYETLKDDEKRETYDYKLRKYLETHATTERVSAAQRANATPDERAGEEFETGFTLLMNEEYAEAILTFSRAVHMAPNNAKYHAYLGKALSFDDKQKHKAEAEIQSAVKMEPGNITFRIMLIELYIQFNLRKRAEGELQRFLSQYPDNREAIVLKEQMGI